MTETEKIEMLQNLLGDVIHSLEMTQYEIDDPSESYNVRRLADHYHAKMLEILHSEHQGTFN
jgi:hypothetical protein